MAKMLSLWLENSRLQMKGCDVSGALSVGQTTPSEAVPRSNTS